MSWLVENSRLFYWFNSGKLAVFVNKPALNNFVMTFSKFCAATQYVQKTVLLFHGVYLMERKIDDLLAVLYQVDGFYVEVYFRDNSTGIYQIKSYADVNCIDPYLRMVDISELTDLV